MQGAFTENLLSARVCARDTGVLGTVTLPLPSFHTSMRTLSTNIQIPHLLGSWFSQLVSLRPFHAHPRTLLQMW